MRNPAPFVLASILRLSAPAFGADLDSPEDLARLVFAALKSDRIEGLEPAMATEADILWAVAEIERRAGEEAGAEARTSLEKRGGTSAVAEQARKRAIAGFKKAREESAREFDWSGAEFDGFVFEADRSVKGLSAGDLELLARSGGCRYRFGLDACGKVERGWISSDGLEFEGIDGCLTEAAFARRAFDALKSGEYDRVEIILPTREDMTWAFEEMARNGNSEARESLEESGGLDALLAEMRRENKKAFDRSLEKSGKLFEWVEAVFAGVATEKNRLRREDGITNGNVYFHVEVESVRYLVKLNECARLKRGWICTDGVRFLGRRD